LNFGACKVVEIWILIFATRGILPPSRSLILRWTGSNHNTEGKSNTRSSKVVVSRRSAVSQLSYVLRYNELLDTSDRRYSSSPMSSRRRLSRISSTASRIFCAVTSWKRLKVSCARRALSETAIWDDLHFSESGIGCMSCFHHNGQVNSVDNHCWRHISCIGFAAIAQFLEGLCFSLLVHAYYTILSIGGGGFCYRSAHDWDDSA